MRLVCIDMPQQMDEPVVIKTEFFSLFLVSGGETGKEGGLRLADGRFVSLRIPQPAER